MRARIAALLLAVGAFVGGAAHASGPEPTPPYARQAGPCDTPDMCETMRMFSESNYNYYVDNMATMIGQGYGEQYANDYYLAMRNAALDMRIYQDASYSYTYPEYGYSMPDWNLSGATYPGYETWANDNVQSYANNWALDVMPTLTSNTYASSYPSGYSNSPGAGGDAPGGGSGEGGLLSALTSQFSAADITVAVLAVALTLLNIFSARHAVNKVLGMVKADGAAASGGGRAAGAGRGVGRGSRK